jgi:hypothetical protein
LHSVPAMDLDILFETNSDEINQYINTHNRYEYHKNESDTGVLMLCDA